MLISKIIEIAEAQSDETYEIEEWLDLYNMCQDDLTPVAKMIDTKPRIEIDVAFGAAVLELSEDEDLAASHRILDVYYTPAGGDRIKLRRLDYEDTLSKGWKMDTTSIYLQGLGEEESGLLDVSHYKRLTHCVYDADKQEFTPESPEIPEEFHPLYISFLCYKSQQREEEPNDEDRFHQEYQVGKEIFSIARTVQIEPWKAKYLGQQAQAKTGGE